MISAELVCCTSLLRGANPDGVRQVYQTRVHAYLNSNVSEAELLGLRALTQSPNGLSVLRDVTTAFYQQTYPSLADLPVIAFTVFGSSDEPEFSFKIFERGKTLAYVVPKLAGLSLRKIHSGYRLSSSNRYLLRRYPQLELPFHIGLPDTDLGEASDAQLSASIL